MQSVHPESVAGAIGPQMERVGQVFEDFVQDKASVLEEQRSQLEVLAVDWNLAEIEGLIAEFDSAWEDRP